MALNLQHQTTAQLCDRIFARIRQAYNTGNMLEFHRLVRVAYERFLAGDLTSDQLKAAYNTAYGKSVSAGQWNSVLSGSMLPVKDRHIALLTQGDLG